MVALRKDMTQGLLDEFLASLKYLPNRFQLKVLESIAFGSGNIIVDAKAGSGKTSLLKQIAALLKFMVVDPDDVLFLAFNNSIVNELNAQLPSGFTAKTSYKVGNAMCTQWKKDHNVPFSKLSDKKYSDIAYEIAERLYPDTELKSERLKMKPRIQSLIKNIMVNALDPRDTEAIENIVWHHAIEDITPAIIAAMPSAIDEVIRRFKENGEMDFIDQVYMPVKLGMQPEHRYKYVLIDESQDLNSLQQEITAKMVAADGRVIIVGDPGQSLYAFAGADANAFWNMQTRFNAEKLDLNICYRCPTSHIALAQSIVPTIEAAPGAIEGTIEYKHLINDLAKTMTPGSMVICRLNAPLLSAYFQLIIAEKPAIILGRSIGKNLIKIVDKVAEERGFTYAKLGKYLTEYHKFEKERLEKRPNTESKIAELTDSIECLQLCAGNFNCLDVECFKQKLEALFVDAGDKSYDPKDVVTCCTVHKAKGLEADHIGIIYQRPKTAGGIVEWKDIMPLTWEKQRKWEKVQEANIKYVAFTRAKKVLTVFGGYKAGEMPDISGSGIDPDMLDELLEEQEDELMTDTPEIEDPQDEPVLNLTVPEDAQPADERFRAAHNILLKCAKALSSAMATDDARIGEDYLEDAERHGKDWQVAFSKAQKDHDMYWKELVEIFGGEERARLIQYDHVRDWTYYTATGERDIESTLAHVIEVLVALSKPIILAGDVLTADDFIAGLQSQEPQTESVTFIDREVIKARTAEGYGLLTQIAALLETALTTTDYLTKTQQTREAHETAIKHSTWLTNEDFSIPELRSVASDANAFTIKHQHVDTICREASWMENDRKDRAIQFALDEVKRVMAAMPQHESTVAPAESPVDESPAEQPIEPRFPGLEQYIQPPVESVAWANWLLVHKDDVVILDTETTDVLDKNNPNKKVEIVQIAVIALDTTTLLTSFIKPIHAEINPDAAAIHGITLEILEAKGATDFAANFPDIKAAIENKHIVIYNHDFDKKVLEGCAKLHGVELPAIKGWHCAMLRYVAHNPNKMTTWGKPGGWWKLTEALEQEGLTPDENAHDALADVLMTRQLIEQMATNDVNKWRSPKPVVIEQPVATEPVVAETPVTIETPVEPAPEPVVVPDIDTDKHIAADSPAIVDEPNVPDKHEDPYEKIKGIFQKLTLEETLALADLLQEVIDEKRAEAITQ